MSERELTGVLAHELAHVKNRDILISSIAATLAGVIMMIANMAQWAAIFGGFSRSDDDEGGGGMLGLILMAILAPLAATIIQMAISRTREYAAGPGRRPDERRPPKVWLRLWRSSASLPSKFP